MTAGLRGVAAAAAPARPVALAGAGRRDGARRGAATILSKACACVGCRDLLGYM